MGELVPLPFGAGESWPIPEPTFEEWWRLYPRKQGKAEARKRWTRMTPAEHVAAAIGLQHHLGAYRMIEPQFIPHGSTWLNQSRWEDDPPPIPQSRRSAPGMNGLRSLQSDPRFSPRQLGS